MLQGVQTRKQSNDDSNSRSPGEGLTQFRALDRLNEHPGCDLLGDRGTLRIEGRGGIRCLNSCYGSPTSSVATQGIVGARVGRMPSRRYVERVGGGLRVKGDSGTGTLGGSESPLGGW